MVCLLLAIPVGAFLAVIIMRSDAVGRRLGAIALSSQLAVPLYVFAGGWSAGVGIQGWMRLDHWLGPTGAAWMQGWLGKLLAVSLIHALASIPWVCLIVSLGLQSCDRNEEEMALMDGGWPMLIRRIWWPRLRVWLWAACLWCSMGLITEMVVSNLYMFPTIAELIYLDVSRGTITPWTYIVATALCTMPVFVFGWWLSRRLPALNQVLVKPLHFEAMQIQLGRYRSVLSLAFWMILLLMVGLPMVNLAIKAGWTPLVDQETTIGFTWTGHRFFQTMQESLTMFRSEFYWSLTLAIASSAVALTVSTALYWITSKSVASGFHSHVTNQATAPRKVIHILMILLVAIPGPMVSTLITRVLNQPGFLGDLYYKTLTAPIVAQQFRLLPLAWLLICGLMATISTRSWELALTDGLSRRQILKTVIVPQVWRRLLMASVLLGLMSVGELSCTIGVLPPGVTTTSMRLFEILHFGMRHQDSALCGLVVALGWLAAIVMSRAVTPSRAKVA